MVVFGISSRSSLYIQERCVSKQKETYVVWRGRGSLVHHQYVWSRSRRLRPLRFLRTENNVGEEFLFSFFSFLLYSTRCPWESCVFHFSHFELYLLMCIEYTLMCIEHFPTAFAYNFPQLYIYICIYIYIYIHAIFMMNFHLLNSYTYFKKFRYSIFRKQ